MKIAIMQPYFFPYIGYFQLISSVDKFVVYDNIKYTKKGWINRNYILNKNSQQVFSIPLVKSSDFLNIIEKEISKEFNRQKLLSRIRSYYCKAPYFDQVWDRINNIISFKENNLFFYLKNSISEVCNYLDINSDIIISSTIKVDHSSKSQEKILSICNAMNAKQYINPIGGSQLYSKKIFENNGVILKFIKPNKIEYKQFTDIFVPSLSILDVIMFNSQDECKQIINFEYSLD